MPSCTKCWNWYSEEDNYCYSCKKIPEDTLPTVQLNLAKKEINRLRSQVRALRGEVRQLKKGFGPRQGKKQHAEVST